MEGLGELEAKCWAIREENFPPVITLSYPTQTTTVSVTGADCALDCAHCGGVYLRRMTPLATVAGRGEGLGPSCLISGGCTAGGGVPLAVHAGRLAALKSGRRFNIHTGLIDDADIDVVAPLADTVSFDFVGADDTIREVFGLNRKVADYAACYHKLRARCRVAPHVCIGLHGGEIRGEYQALALLKLLGADSLTLIVFTPTRGTRYAGRKPPDLDAALTVMAAARQLFPDVPVRLGCMRPGGRYRDTMDQAAVRLGFNAIVKPTPAAVRLAESLGLTAVGRGECCVL
ncbi:radical SAM protein [Anaeroselena agilis]|uniref:Radical SAM protein n=1 Tax=Anaeroselena agilis TaxID=3063788 RepID=A0ABU3P252_9FIRM|nr:radical SAM protein [Selenomonadales bacterium 4137-cl]